MKAVTRQEKEDYLETMYLMKRKGNQITKKDVGEHLGVAMSRVNHVMGQLMEEGYLWKDQNRRYFLTCIGVNRGREYLERHRCLTEFLQLVSGAQKDVAEQNACRIEHVLDDTVYLGIRTFMERRHTFSYTMCGNDLNFLFPYGTREMPIAIYIKGTAHPRRLADEYYKFQKKAMTEICEESHLYLIPEAEEMKQKNVWYFDEGMWKKAQKNEKGFAILSETLECNIRRNDKITEGRLLIAIEDADQEKVQKENARVLVVSLI